MLDVSPFSLILGFKSVESAAIDKRSTCRKKSSKTLSEGFVLNLL